MTAREIKEWLDENVEENEQVGIDDGGLTLVSEKGAYLEVGGELIRPTQRIVVETEED